MSHQQDVKGAQVVDKDEDEDELEYQEGEYVWVYKNSQEVLRPNKDRDLHKEPIFKLMNKEWRIVRVCEQFNEKLGLFLQYAGAGEAHVTMKIFVKGDKGWKHLHEDRVRLSGDKDMGRWIPFRELEFETDKQTLTFKMHIIILPAEWPPRCEYVGIRNQGATCYMNSFLQYIFHIPDFRQFVYSMPANNPNDKQRIGLALQRLFAQLQTNNYRHSVETTELTRAFGWHSFEAFQQHDVQEFARLFCDHLENVSKGTKAQGFIQKLFEGKSEMYIECLDVDYKSSRQEIFLDLQLNVKGIGSLEASFDNYVAEEMLDGNNKYRAEKHGPQRARKGIRFIKFPPVLQLQLKRFEYDPQQDSMVKIHDNLTFPTTLDLSKYVDHKTAEQGADKPIYELHSVLVHSGFAGGGHYYAYVRPFRDRGAYADARWYKFDDDWVQAASPREAIDDNFGKRPGEYYSRSSAYMLVYVQKSMCERLQKAAVKQLSPQMQPQSSPNQPVPPLSVSGAAKDAKDTKDSKDNKVAAAAAAASAPAAASAAAAPGATTLKKRPKTKPLPVELPAHLVNAQPQDDPHRGYNFLNPLAYNRNPHLNLKK